MDLKKVLNTTKIVMAKAGTTVLEQIEERRKWKIISVGKLSVNEEDRIVKINHKIYSFSDILDAELIEDGSSVIKSSLLGTAAKGFAFGLAGYLSASKKEKRYCNKLELKITIHDFKNPCIYFKFISKKIKKDSKDYNDAIEEAQRCLSAIKIIQDSK